MNHVYKFVFYLLAGYLFGYFVVGPLIFMLLH